jgi:hypothetical protein
MQNTQQKKFQEAISDAMHNTLVALSCLKEKLIALKELDFLAGIVMINIYLHKVKYTKI